MTIQVGKDMSKTRNQIHGLLSMVLGSALVFATVVLINKFAEGPKGREEINVAKIDFEKKEKPKANKQVRKQEQPKPRPRRQAPAPLTGLDSSLAGLDLGLEGLDASDFGNLSGDLLGGADEVVMTDDSVDEPPRPTLQNPMMYPPRAKANGIEGYVLMSVLISPTGEVERVKVLESFPSGIFDDTAVAGVRSWKFEPASYQGESVRVWAKQRVRFDLS
jgi:protein TonB